MLVSNGVYAVSTNLAVATNITVQSVNGPGVTTVYRLTAAGTLFAIFRVTHSNAVVSGFSITNGFWSLNNDCGGSVHMTAGTVSNCWIINTPYIGGTQSGAAYVGGGLLTSCILSNCVPRTWALRMYGGVVENCLITRNNNPYDTDAPVDIYGGTMRRCRIVGNWAGGSGSGGVQMSAGRMENCLIYGNWTTSSAKPGGVELTGGAMVNCTIASNANAAAASVGAGVARSGSSALTNCIVYGNSGAGGVNYSGAASAAWYSCAPELTVGVQGNVNGNPRFVNIGAGDCHLDFGSSAVNSGTNVPGITVDLDGTNRDAQCDMGAFERVASGGPVTVAFSGLPLTGIGSVTSVFTAVLEGGDTNITWWGWDFDNNGSYEQSGGGLQVVTNIFSPGRYSVRVQVTNSSLQSASWTNLNYVSVQSAGNDLYVATNGSHSFPFDTWAKAATNLTDAYSTAVHPGMNVWISNGVYGVTAQMALSTNIAVRSMNGPDVTTVYRVSGDFPIFNLSHTSAWVSGFTITNGTYSLDAGAVRMSNGTVSNCVITKSYRTGGGGQGTTLISGGLMTQCIISNNDCRSWCVYVSGGTLENSLIAGSWDHSDNAPLVLTAGAVRRCRLVANTPGNCASAAEISGGLMENCLVWGNRSTRTDRGAVYMTGGRMVHCTVASNNCTAVPTVSGVALTGGTLTNCVIYGNQSAGAQYSGAAASAWFSCAPELTAGVQGNITGNPLFAGLATGNLHLSLGSPCIDTGTNLVSVTNDLNLAVRPINGDGVPGAVSDMGCYEEPDTGAGAVSISFTGTPVYGFVPMQVVFTSAAVGADTNIVWYGWDFDNNGSFDLSGPALRVATNTYNTPGTYTVALQVTNSSGTTAQSTNVNYVTVVNPYIYVATNGTHISPFSSWTTAATNINAAVAIAVAAQTVLVSNGVYAVTTNLAVGAFRVQSVNGPGVTTLYRPSSVSNKMFVVSDANAWVSGFTITNAYVDIYGSGQALELSAGTVSNCIITKCNSQALGGLQAYMALISGGLMTHCVISNNQSRSRVVGVFSGGILQDSVLSDNSTPYDPSTLYISGTASTARRCRIFRNTGAAGGAYIGENGYGGRMENCFLWGNYGGAVRIDSGWMVNCTVASNSAAGGAPAGGLYRTGGAVTNCIVYGNTVGGVANNYGGSASAAWFSCAPELTAGSQGNVNSDPKFNGMATGDCQLQLGSPCVNAGTNLPGITVDIDGASRDANTDMGAFERIGGAGPLAVSFLAAPLTGIGSVTSVFSVVASGNNTTLTWYGWDFDNNGTFELTGAGLGTVTNVYAPGRYSIRLLATNSILESASATNLDYVAVKSAGNDVYVATNGSAIFPYDTWVKAATNINDAVGNAAHGGSTVWVSNGVYGVSPGLTLVTNVTVRSVNGPNVTTLYRSSALNFALLNLSHANACVAGFTVTNGAGIGQGGALTMSAGMVSNCVMTRNVVGTYPDGVMSMSGGLVTGCLISNNTPRSVTVMVTGGILEDTVITGTTAGHDLAPLTIGYGITGGTVRRCKIINNTPPGAIAGGVQIHCAGRLENCLVYGNKAQNSPYGAVLIGGGAPETVGGTMLNCTVASNSTVSGAAGVTMSGGGTMTNCIVYGNNAAFPNYTGAVSAVWYSCAPELTAGVQGNVTGDPLFKNVAQGDCRLRGASPCINIGTNLPGISGTTDLDGVPRVQDGTVDMGAYESSIPGTLFKFR